MQPVPGILTPPFGVPGKDEPWVGRPIIGTDPHLPDHPGPIETPSLVNTPGSSPPEDKILEGEGVPPGDSTGDMDLF